MSRHSPSSKVRVLRCSLDPLQFIQGHHRHVAFRGQSLITFYSRSSQARCIPWAESDHVLFKVITGTLHSLGRVWSRFIQGHHRHVAFLFLGQSYVIPRAAASDAQSNTFSSWEECSFAEYTNTARTAWCHIIVVEHAACGGILRASSFEIIIHLTFSAYRLKCKPLLRIYEDT